MASLELKPGICSRLVELFEINTQTMTDNEKPTSILLDEILCGSNDVDHKGDCSANLPPDAPISREADYILKAAKDIQQQNADPTSMTKDGDGPVHKALLELYGADNLEIRSNEHLVTACFKNKKKEKPSFLKQCLTPAVPKEYNNTTSTTLRKTSQADVILNFQKHGQNLVI